MSEVRKPPQLPSNRPTRWSRAGTWLVFLMLVPTLLEASVAPQLKLALINRVHLSAPAFVEMAGELDRVLPTKDTEIAWLPQNHQLAIYSPQGEIQVILSPSSPEAWGFDASVMAAVLSPKRESPGGVIVVFAARVARVVGAREYKNLSDRMPRDTRLARALARVLAHEIVHVVVPDHRHGDDGIMQESQSQTSLLEADPRMDPACTAAFQTRLPAYLSAVERLAATTSPESEVPIASTPE